MRIRKNRKLSSFMPAELIQAYDCQLNQSPWDVISFSEETDADKSSLHHFERENSHTKDGSLDKFMGGIVGSDTSLMKRAGKAVIDVEDISLKNGDGTTANNPFGLNEGERSKRCDRTDRKGRQCPNESKQNHSLPQSDNLRTDTPAASDLVCKNSEKTESTAAARRDRPRRMKKSSSSTSNAHEFYYYSGFGPYWGKKRGGVEDTEGNNSKLDSAQIDKEKVKCIEEEEKEDDGKEKNNNGEETEGEINDNGNEKGRNKRMKSVKAPSVQWT